MPYDSDEEADYSKMDLVGFSKLNLIIISNFSIFYFLFLYHVKT